MRTSLVSLTTWTVVSSPALSGRPVIRRLLRVPYGSRASFCSLSSRTSTLGTSSFWSHSSNTDLRSPMWSRPQFAAFATKSTPTITNAYLDLVNGTQMPQLGLGTWQESQSEDEVRRSLETALDTGYKLVDTARVYGNEHIVGEVLKERFSNGSLKREDIFITSKIHPIYFGSKDLVHRCVELSLKTLQLDYLDLYLLHFPVGIQFNGDDNFYPLDEEGNLLMDMNSDFVRVWKALEEYVDNGRIKALGVSNFTVSQIERLQAAARHPVCNNQVEMNVYLQQRPLVDFCQKAKITVTAYASLGSPGSEHMKGGKYPSLLKDETISSIAATKGKTPAQVAMRFLIQEGVAIIPKSVTPSRVVQNNQLFDFTLTDEEMETLRKKDQNMRTFFMSIGKGHPEYPF